MSAAVSSDVREYFDLTYSNEAASYYLLLIELDGSILRACWYHQNKNLVTGFASYSIGSKDFETGLANLLNDHPFLKSEFNQCIVTIRTSNYTLLPRSSEIQSTQALFELTNSLDPDTEVLLEHDLVGARTKVLFSINGVTERTLKSSFLNVMLVPHVAPRIERELSRLKTSVSQKSIFAHITDEQIDVQVYKDGKLHLANSFFQSGKEDIAYYILYTAEVLEVEPEKTPLTLSGNIEIADPCWKMLSEYWKQMNVVQSLEKITLSTQLGDFSQPEFNHLTYSLLCAS